MGQRRKHVTQNAISQDVQPPEHNQHIVRALGSRGGNIVEVEYPHGTATLCIMPAKFKRKLWVRRGGYLIIEASPEAEQDSSSRVTGTICAVLYDEHIKQLRKMPGVWPPEFTTAQTSQSGAAANYMDSHDSEENDHVSEAEGSQPDAAKPSAMAAAATAGAQQQQHASTSNRQCPDAADGERGSHEDESGAKSDSDSELPPLQQINNRSVVQIHDWSDSSDDERTVEATSSSSQLPSSLAQRGTSGRST